MYNPHEIDINDTFQKSVKPPFRIGSNIVVILDKTIVQKLRINENDTFFEQEITKDGILMRIRKMSNNGCYK